MKILYINFLMILLTVVLRKTVFQHLEVAILNHKEKSWQNILGTHRIDTSHPSQFIRTEKTQIESRTW